MKILLVNKYFYLKGGAEQVMFDTADILLNNGNEVSFFSMKHPQNRRTDFEKYFVGNVSYDNQNIKQSVKATLRLLYSWEARKNVDQLINICKPEIAHLHNIYHQISPSIIHSLKKAGIPIVMTLHDYKTVCASYLMLCKGSVCEACRNQKYYNCFLKSCTKNSYLKSLLNTFEMYLHHYLLNIFKDVDVFISPSLFLIDKIHSMGFKHKIVHLPNFVDSKRFVPNYSSHERYICFVGRLSNEKGINLLIDAMMNLDLTLKIVGDGPLRNELQLKVKQSGALNIEFLGFLDSFEIKKVISNSMFTVMPSICYENYPLAVIESFALGKPVIGSRIGGIPELVQDNITGMTFTPGDKQDLKNKISFLSSDTSVLAKMGINARNLTENLLSAERHYEGLIDVYKLALKSYKPNIVTK